MRRILVLVGCLAICPASFAQRLSGDIVPESYDLTLSPDLDRASFEGEEVIHVRLKKPTAKIVLNSAEIEFREVSVTAGAVSQRAQTSIDAASEQVSFSTMRAVPRGPAEIHIRYSGILNDKLRGFYLSQTPRRRYAVTQFEATDARRAFPSFDEPEYKAVFRLTLIVNKGDTAISAGRIISDVPGPGNAKHTLTFSPSPKMSTYLLSMIVGDFQCREGGADGIPIRLCAVPEKSSLTPYALTATENLLKNFNRYFYTKYPYDKLDIIAFPDFSAGAMENTAAITYRESLLLIDEKTASLDLKATVALILSHEIAHQWFGDLVTMKWWDDVWLNEGFASWMAWKPVENWKPEWHLQLGEMQETDTALAGDGISSIRPIRANADKPAEIAALFDGIAYGKAASVLRMVEAYLGPETFRRGVNEYLRKHAYGNATAEDFWNELARISGKPADKIMTAFIDQPGAPLVSVSPKCLGDTSVVTLSQQRYFADRKKLQGNSPELWPIPLVLEAPGSPKVTVLLTGRQQTIKFPGCASIFANAAGFGYYRTKYDSDSYTKLIPELDRSLTGPERIRFLSDSWALVHTGQLNIAEYLKSIEQLGKERRRTVVGEMLASLYEIHDRVAAEKDRKAFEHWVRSLLQPVRAALAETPAESEEARALRADIDTVLTDVGEDGELIRQNEALAQSYMTDPSSVPGNLAGRALRVAAQNGNAFLYDRYLEHLKTARTPAEYSVFLQALPRFSDPALMTRTFDFFLSTEVRAQDLSRLNAILLRDSTQKAAWEMYKARFPEIREKAGDSLGVGLVAVAGFFCDPALRDDSQVFFASQKIPGTERSLKNALEQVNACIDLRELQQANLSSYLQTRTAN